MKTIPGIISALLLMASHLASTQTEGKSVPDSVFYLTPKFEKGYIYYNDKAGSAGTFNICAIDNTVRFFDKSQELAAVDDGTITGVTIESCRYVKKNDEFAKLININGAVSVAVVRRVLIMTDSHVGAYGMESQTTATQNYLGIVSDRMYKLDEVRNFPYRISEEAFLYLDGKFLPVNKKNFEKCFPAKKSEIEKFFTAKKLRSGDVDEILTLARSMAE